MTAMPGDPAEHDHSRGTPVSSGAGRRVTVEVLRVFTDHRGGHGNRLGIVAAGIRASERQRQALAYRLGFSETVFISGPGYANVGIYTPATRVPYAGHAAVGAAWWRARNGLAPPALRLSCGVCTTAELQGLTWVSARTAWCPSWRHVRLDQASDITSLTGPPQGHDAVQVWAFEDEEAGVIRARVFAGRFGVREDEACGSATQLLCARLARPLVVHHGAGSEIFVRPASPGWVELGGRVRAESRQQETLLP
jgi:predicted PhzF superfamily epimerase YddE/YHI9